MSKILPLKLWDDAGSTGRKGSIWQTGALSLLYATDGHEIPQGEVFMDLLRTPLVAAFNFVSAGPASPGGGAAAQQQQAASSRK